MHALLKVGDYKTKNVKSRFYFNIDIYYKQFLFKKVNIDM